MNNVLFYIAIALSVVGVIISIIYSVRLLVSAFRESLFWGLASLLLPLAGLIYVIRFWKETRPLVIGQLIGTAFLVAAAFVAPFDKRELLQHPGEGGIGKRRHEALSKEKARDLERTARLQDEAKDRARQLFGYLENWQAELKAKSPGPAASAAEVKAFNQEHSRYIGLLEEYKTMAKGLASPTPAR